MYICRALYRFLFILIWKQLDSCLGGISPRSIPEANIHIQVVYLSGDPGNSGKEYGSETEVKRANISCIIK